MKQDVFYQDEPDQFYATIRKRVYDYLNTTGYGRFANPFFFIKAALLISLYLSCYLMLIFAANEGLALAGMILMGPLAILIGINVAHDAAHGNISRHRIVNSSFQLLFDLLGANSYMWKKRHVFSHHEFPNILDQDADLKQNPMVRIFPGSELKKAHRYQYLYAPFLYLFYTINWLFVRDWQDYTEKKIGSLNIDKHPLAEYMKLVFFKLFYVSYLLVIPALYSPLSAGELVLGFLAMNFAASLLITLALIPSHVAENSLFLLPNEDGKMAHSWSHHQLLSVIDFATANVFLNFFFGGFNHHIAHHLFPEICHAHCVPITRIVKQTTEEFNLPYHHENSFLNAYSSHFQLLKNNGKAITA